MFYFLIIIKVPVQQQNSFWALKEIIQGVVFSFMEWGLQSEGRVNEKLSRKFDSKELEAIVIANPAKEH